MPIYETYSERQRRLQQGATPDVYKYDRIPEKLRVQIVHIMNDGFGSYFDANGKKNWSYLENQIARSEARQGWHRVILLHNKPATDGSPTADAALIRFSAWQKLRR